MAKEATYYFRHDCNARQDERILSLRMKHGWEGYGLFWAIVERLRESPDYACIARYDILAYDMHTTAELVQSVVEDFGLFAFTTPECEEDTRFFSARLCNDMEEKDKASQAARKSISKRWEKKSKAEDNAEEEERNTTVIREEEESNAEEEARNTTVIRNAYDRNTTVIRNAYDRNTTVLLKEKKKKKEKEEKNNTTTPPLPPQGGEEAATATTQREEQAQPPTEPKATRANARFQAPTLEEVKAYAREIDFEHAAEEFLDHFLGNGWKLKDGKPVKDWRATLRNWKRHREKHPTPTPTTTPSPPLSTSPHHSHHYAHTTSPHTAAPPHATPQLPPDKQERRAEILNIAIADALQQQASG